MTGKEAIKKLQAAGWVLDRIEGAAKNQRFWFLARQKWPRNRSVYANT